MISDNTRKLLLDYEVGGGEKYYNAVLKHPTWPGVASGVTVGIGYDLGYNSAETIRVDWSALPNQNVHRLTLAAGVKGEVAGPLARKLSDITVPWEAALKVFEAVTVPRFSALTLSAYPGAEKLHPDAFGALLSLVFNRGSSLSGHRRLEMKAIVSLVKKKDYSGIADKIREMKRLWPNVRGLRRRRDAEAALVESVVGRVEFRT